MQQFIKRYLWVALLVVGAQASWGFALSGPLTANGKGDKWQTAIIGYNLPEDLETPRNIGEEYRLNIPVVYYAFDASFSGFFGSNGESAVVSALGIMNQVTNVDNYHAALDEYSDQSLHYDTTALALDLTDLKSETLTVLAEQMGLSEPERYAWTLHDRYLPPSLKCPNDELYLVVQRNFDPMTGLNQQVQYSPYVNNTLYTYGIFEHCTGANPLASTYPLGVDPLADTYTSVAGNIGGGINLSSTYGGVGSFYTDLTRDDVAGLRYLYRTNNVNWETPDSGAFWYNITTNVSSPQLFPNYNGTNIYVVGTNTLVGYTTNTVTTGGTNGYNYFYYYDGTYGYGNYGTLVELSKTNSPATMLALYPGLVIASSSNYFALGSNGVVTTFYTNYTGSPIGSPPVSVTVTNYQPAIIEYYVTKFANVFTNKVWSTNTTSYLLTTTVGPKAGYPIGSGSATNVTMQTVITTNVPSGDFFILPQFYTNVCPLSFQSSTAILTNVLSVTNVLTSASTNVITTNAVSVPYATSLSVVTVFTNYIWVVNPVSCVQETNATTWYQGIGRIQFKQAPDSSIADPLTDTFTTPVTNNYSMVAYNPTNNAYETRNFQRILLAPDIRFSAEDLATPQPGIIGIGTFYYYRTLGFNAANALPNLAGPGTIQTPSLIAFSKAGSAYENGSLALNTLTTNEYLSEYTQTVGLLGWGTFNGSTNDPVAYPDGTSIYNIENQLIISITPSPGTGLADGFNGVAYPAVQFYATGGVSPYVWSVATGTSLPAGLSLSTGGVLAGTPANNLAGVYDFTIQLTDAANRVVNFNYSITIH